MNYATEVNRIATLMNDHAAMLTTAGMDTDSVSAHIKSLRMTSVKHIDTMIAASVAMGLGASMTNMGGDSYLTVAVKPFTFNLKTDGSGVSMQHDDNVEINQQKIMNEILSDPSVTPLITALTTCMQKGADMPWEEYAEIKHELINAMLQSGVGLTSKLKSLQIIEE